MNRLSRERSPYLLQHASDPVDWFPWSEEAFAKARQEEKPIFLSIGYSTCHWCHVMEHESFENPAIAGVLNEHFVSIKVDREERPDVDRVYMTFVQATTGSGGWPMSVWLTPDLEPFFGGTYFPPDSRWGRPGFVDLLEHISQTWREDEHKVRESAASITERLRGAAREQASASVPNAHALSRAVQQFEQAFDSTYGGFGSAPKFPRPSELLFLLREHARTGSMEARKIALATLSGMALGGMRDHIGGGFHRYSVDPAWRVPHFEKMLYDQAQLVLAYIEAAQASRSRVYLDVAEDTLRYVMREMTDEGGGFYSAEDADSIPPEQQGHPDAHKSEGAFYLWTAREVDELLGRDAEIVKRHFGIEPDGNAPIDPQKEFVGKNLLYVAQSEDALTRDMGLAADEPREALGRARLTMFRSRLGRPRPHLDDKVLTSWNGLMIGAFARAARAVGGYAPDRSAADLYREAARRAATFLHDRMWDPASRTLLRRFRDGHAEIDGYAEDYAYLIFGLLELFQADPDPRWLGWAIELQRRQDELFWDEAEAGWFSTTGRDPTVLLRLKEDYDGAEPTASAVSVLNLLVLTHLVEDSDWPVRIERTLRLFGPRLEQTGRAVPMMAAALSAFTAGLHQIVIVGDEGAELERAVESRYLPFAIVLRLRRDQQEALARLMPWVAAMHATDGQPVAYVCREFSCQAPARSVSALEAQLPMAPRLT